ncbi:MAG: hypothetical protein A2Y17_07630 [Clostridiales bacterium GWF2_38_85]|nr:MAG: hypothetical protein A2Y17_07630 [Clostridiales bacterium GWF2_38_85]HBL84255.1 histidinol phosphate phosphatase [Clostridiales bacterium]
MFLADYHTHSKFSFDAERPATIEAMCEAAITMGLNEIAITDHYECDAMPDGFYEMPDLDGRQTAIAAAKKKYEGKLALCYGIELGQPTSEAVETERILSKYSFDFVIGSLHTVKGIRDICYINYEYYSDKQIVMLWEQYLAELLKHIKDGKFDTLAHITYPYRYIVKNGRGNVVNLDDYKDEFAAIIRAAIERGIALECNTSGLRQTLAEPMPNFKLMQLYKSLGGQLITVGSDAHYLEHIGSHIKETVSTLADIGFKYLTVFRNRRPTMIKI